MKNSVVQMNVQEGRLRNEMEILEEILQDERAYEMVRKLLPGEPEVQIAA